MIDFLNALFEMLGTVALLWAIYYWADRFFAMVFDLEDRNDD